MPRKKLEEGISSSFLSLRTSPTGRVAILPNPLRMYRIYHAERKY